MQKMYCPNITNSYKIKQSLSQTNPTYVSITLQICDPSSRQNCDPSSIVDQIYNLFYVKVWIYILDNAIHPSDKQSRTYRISMGKAILTPQIYQFVEILMSSWRIQTDVSVLPWEKADVLSGEMFDTMKNNPDQYDVQNMWVGQVLAEFHIGMNNKIKIYTRDIGKFDQVISYAGGLFAIVVPALALFLLNYNKYRYEIKVAQGAFNFDEQGNRIKQSGFHFITYIKYSFYIWLNRIFCGKIKWKSCNDIDQARQNIIALMDVRRMFRRLHKIEQSIHLKIDEEQDAGIALMQPRSLMSVRKQRLKLDYYEEVVKGEAAITLQDILQQEKQGKNELNRRSSTEQINNGYQQQIGSATNLHQGGFNYYATLNFNREKSIDFKLIYNLKNGYKLIQDTVNFVKTKQKAQRIQLAPQFQQIQNHLAQVYSSFNYTDKHLIENRVPMVILHRLNKINQQNQQNNKNYGNIFGLTVDLKEQ